jgi:glycine/D-amino acid oxidase-like deaminating enzyme
MNTPTADVVVIGGGIVGTATAYYLSKFGVKVRLLDRGSIASGASGSGEGNLILSNKHPGPEMELGKLALQTWADLAEELPMDFEYERKGSILFTDTEAGAIAVTERVKIVKAEGIEGHLLARQQIRECEPYLAEDVAGVALFPGDAQVQPMLACWAMADAARANGAAIETHTEVVGFERDVSGAVTSVLTNKGKSVTRTVVTAAGPWSPSIGQMVGVDIPVKPRRGHVVVTEPAPKIVYHKMLEATYLQTIDTTVDDLQVSSVVEDTRSGTILLGSSREFVGFDPNPRLDAIQRIVQRAIRFFPVLSKLHAIRAYTGFRPYTPDHKPILGPCESVPGFYLATGHEGGGICLGPITGKLMAQLLTGRVLDLPLEPYALKRFEGVKRET